MSHGSQSVSYRGRSYRIPDDEAPESFFPPELPGQGKGLFYWDPAGDDGEGPEHCMSIRWEADANGIDDENLAIEHLYSFEYSPGRSRVPAMPGQLVAFLAWLEEPEHLRDVVRTLEEQRRGQLVMDFLS